MGLNLGAHCVGCCWLLMALLFIAGVMNLWWIARASGIMLLLWGGWMLTTAVRA
jgi:predicted metal-binding membrane protein